MKEYYANIMYRDKSGDLKQENIYYLAKNKTQARVKAKSIANDKEARLVAFYINT